LERGRLARLKRGNYAFLMAGETPAAPDADETSAIQNIKNNDWVVFHEKTGNNEVISDR